MKKSVTLILAVVTLVVLIGALIFTNSNSNKAAQAAEESTSSENSSASAKLPVVSLQSEDITSVTVEADSQSLTFIPGEENWSVEGNTEAALDQSALNYKLKTLLSITADRKIENAVLSEYGLDAPVKTVLYLLKDGSAIKLLAGNLSLDKENLYVMLESDPSAVYMIPSNVNNCLVSDINDLRETEIEKPETESISGIQISGTDFENVAISISKEQNGIVTAYELTTDDFDHVSVSNNSFDKFVNALPDFQVEDFLADEVTDLSIYGLDNPSLHLVIDFYDPNAEINEGEMPKTTSTLDFIWGKQLDDGKIAFMKTGEKSVYAMSSSFLADFKELSSPFALSSKFIELTNIADVKAIDIDYLGETYHLDIDEAGEKYTLNNQLMEKDSFKALYRSIIGIYAEIQLDASSGEKTPAITITYTLTDGSKTTASFTQAEDSLYYETLLNGKMLVGCTKAQLESLKTALDEALSANSL